VSFLDRDWLDVIVMKQLQGRLNSSLNHSTPVELQIDWHDPSPFAVVEVLREGGRTGSERRREEREEDLEDLSEWQGGSSNQIVVVGDIVIPNSQEEMSVSREAVHVIGCQSVEEG
jgi:hypothetical protein